MNKRKMILRIGSFFVLFSLLTTSISSQIYEPSTSSFWEDFLKDFLEITNLERCTISIHVQAKLFGLATKFFSQEASRGYVVNDDRFPIPKKASAVQCSLSIIVTNQSGINQSMDVLNQMLKSRQSSFYLLIMESTDPIEKFDDSDCIPNVVSAVKFSSSSLKTYLVAGFSNPSSGLYISNGTNIWKRNKGFLFKSKSHLFDTSPFSTRRLLRVAYPSLSSSVYMAVDKLCLGNRALCGADLTSANYIASKLNVDLQFLPSVDGLWGGLVDAEKNVYDGMIGMVQRKEVDVAVGEITITVARSKEVDFTIPYCETSAGFMVNIPRQLSKWASLLRPYQLNAWLPILVSVSISGPFGFLLFRLSTCRQQRKFTFAKVSLLFYRIFINQEVRLDKVSKIYSQRCLLLTWGIFSFVITSAYVGSLISSLTKPNLSPTVESFKEILDWSSSLKIMIQSPSTSTDQYLRFTNNTILKKLWNIIDKEHTRYKTLSEPLDILMSTENTVVIMDEIQYREKMHPPSQDKLVNENIYFLKETFLPSGYGFACIKGSKFQSAISQLIWRNRQFGLGNRWLLMSDLERRELRRQQNQSSLTTTSTNPELTKFTLSHLQGIFYIFSILMVTLQLAFIIELGSRKLMNHLPR